MLGWLEVRVQTFLNAAEHDVGIYLLCKYSQDEVRRSVVGKGSLLLSLAGSVLQHRGQLPQVSHAPFQMLSVARNDANAPSCSSVRHHLI